MASLGLLNLPYLATGNLGLQAIGSRSLSLSLSIYIYIYIYVYVFCFFKGRFRHRPIRRLPGVTSLSRRQGRSNTSNERSLTSQTKM